MKNFRRDVRGAITIIVSLMLIPAILLSGTAVDLSRIYTARSMAQNANQLAGNAVLTQYHALLQDLYGLFGVMETDEALASMINEYVEVTVFGEKKDDAWIDNGLGAFQTYYGSEVGASVTSAADFNLGNGDMLRRQIEEYMKFRGPVILVTQLLEALTTQGPGIKANNEAIKQQDVVLKSLGEYFELYENLYNAIVKADLLVTVYGTPNVLGAVGNVGTSTTAIKRAFDELGKRYEEWHAVCVAIDETNLAIEAEKKQNEPNPITLERLYNNLEVLQGADGSGGKKEYMAKRYEAKFKHIEALTTGGTWRDFVNGLERQAKDSDEKVVKLSDGNPKMEWREGRLSEQETNVLEGLIHNRDAAIDKAREYKPNFNEVVTAAKAIDDKREELRAELADLQTKIDAPDCDPTIREELQTQIVKCNEFLDKFPDIESLAVKYKKSSDEYIDNNLIRMLNDVKYQDNSDNNAKPISIEDLSQISSKLDEMGFTLDQDKKPYERAVVIYSKYDDVTYHMPEFKKFGEIDENPKGNMGLYESLKEMVSKDDEFEVRSIDGVEDDSNKKGSAKQESILRSLIEMAEKAKDGLISNPKGAREITDASAAPGGWGDIDIGSRFIDIIADPALQMQNMADWVLMMTYDVSMFSNYTSGKPAELYKDNNPQGDLVPKKEDRSSANVLLCPQVNYFYQSEWEYLLIGKQSAIDNLDAVRNLIAAVRLVCNTIASFTITDVKTFANTLQMAANAIPFAGAAIGVVLKLLTHAAFAAAETAWDVYRLRDGHKVPLMKLNANNSSDKNGWQCQLSNVSSILVDLSTGNIETEQWHYHEEEGVSYEQYLIVFFLVSSVMHGDAIGTLADRTGQLIEWNVINVQEKVITDDIINDKGEVDSAQAEAKMAEALAQEDCFRLHNCKTDFDVTTDIDLRLMFLTMPLFERQGATFSDTYRIRAVDKRGY